MSDSSKRRGFSRKANLVARGQKAISSAIEFLESRLLMTSTPVTYVVLSNAATIDTVPGATEVGLITVNTLSDAMTAADNLILTPGITSYAVSIEFALGAPGFAGVNGTTIAPSNQQAVNNAAGSMISLTIGGDATGASFTTVTSTPVTISGASIAGNSLFTVTNTAVSEAVTFQDLNLVNSSNPGGGGAAISGSVTTLNITNDTFTGNTSAGGSGGAINSAGTTLIVQGSTFTSDTAALGAGGAIYSADTSSIIKGDTFISNSAAFGGAVQFAGSTVSADITSSSFTSDTATTDGGALYSNIKTLNLGASATTDNGNDTFTSNSATTAGGAIYSLDNTAIGTFDTFNSNTAPTGGAIDAAHGSAGTFTMTYSAFSSNTATAGAGGAIVNSDATLLIGGTSFSHNTTTTTGGAVSTVGLGTAPLVTFVNETNSVTKSVVADSFANNMATGNGGAIYENGATTTANITASTFSTNVSTGGSGGAVYSDVKQLNLGTGTAIDSFTNNTAAAGVGGAVDSADKLLSSLGTSYSFNSAPQGGGIYISIDTATNFPATVGSATVSGGTFIHNGGIATTQGGAVWNNDATFTVNTSNFGSVGTATVQAVPGLNTAGAVGVGLGGAIYTVAAGTNSFTSDRFLSNSATSGGGALYVGGGTSASTMTLTIFGNSVNPPGPAVPGGNSAPTGGAIDSAGLKFSITSPSSFYNNTASIAGGAIYSADGTLSITSSFFGTLTVSTILGVVTDIPGNGNSAPTGGAVYAADIVLASFISDTFDSNKATAGAGGAIFNSSPSLVDSGSIFYINSATTTGGAISTTGATNAMTGGIVGGANSSAGNTAADGGGVYIAGAGAVDSSIQGVTFTGNIATDGFGGAVASVGTTTSKLNVGYTLVGGTGSRDTFSSNKSTTTGLPSDTTGTIGVGGAVYSTDNTLNVLSTIGGSNVTGNVAAEDGGGLYFNGQGATPLLTVTGSTFAYDTAGAGGANVGGAINDFTTYGLGGGVDVANTGTVSTIGTTTFQNDSAFNLGGGAYTHGATLTFSNDTSNVNSATNYDGGALASYEGTLNIVGGAFTSNTAIGSKDGNGGAVFSHATALTISAGTGKTTFTTNKALNAGGAIDFVAKTGTPSLTITSAVFNNNTAGVVTVGTTTTITPGAVGGAINASGAAIYSLSGSSINITGTSFQGNSAAAYGGAISSFGGAGSSMTLTTDTFTTDSVVATSKTVVSSDGDGGAVFSEDATFSAVSSSFVSCSANTGLFSGTGPGITGPTGGFGGAIYSYPNSFTLTSDSFSADTSSYGGGGAFVFGAALVGTDAYAVSGTTFVNCKATDTFLSGTTPDNYFNGGGLYTAGGDASSGSSLIVTSSTFYGDIASGVGGGMYSADTTLTITGGVGTNSVFGKAGAADTAPWGGGGVYYYGAVGGAATIGYTTFANNTVTGTVASNGPAGGGVYIGSNANSFTAYNDTFNNNTSTYSGGAIFTNAKNDNIALSTFTQNITSKDSGGAIDADSGTVNFNLYDSTLVQNTAKLYGGGVFFDGATANIANDTFYKNIASGSNVSGTATAGGGLMAAGTGLQYIVDSTFTGNESGVAKGGGGIQSINHTLNVANSNNVTLLGDLIAQNTTGTTAASHDDLAGVFNTASAYNIVGDAEGNNQLQLGLGVATAGANHIPALGVLLNLNYVGTSAGYTVGEVWGTGVSAIPPLNLANGEVQPSLGSLAIAGTAYTIGAVTGTSESNNSNNVGTGFSTIDPALATAYLNPSNTSVNVIATYEDNVTPRVSGSDDIGAAN